ncbi:hypothetical protein C1646_727340 [Rhizophagus diaphanus]|nr:hypothetical protein C1646_727340 [Rhizophagus diaphanus] [Rhizophagus sp. MUCL 43196]
MEEPLIFLMPSGTVTLFTRFLGFVSLVLTFAMVEQTFSMAVSTTFLVPYIIDLEASSSSSYNSSCNSISFQNASTSLKYSLCPLNLPLSILAPSFILSGPFVIKILRSFFSLSDSLRKEKVKSDCCNRYS